MKERKHWTENCTEKVREVIDKRITQLEMWILERSHIMKYGDLYGTDGGSEINNISDFEDEKKFLKDILIHIEDTIKHFTKSLVKPVNI